MSKYYMNSTSGEVGTYDDWWYDDEDGEQFNAVDEGEVFEVARVGNYWVEIEQDGDLDFAVDYDRDAAPVLWRNADSDEGWESTPFQTYEVRFGSSLQRVRDWIEAA